MSGFIVHLVVYVAKAQPAGVGRVFIRAGAGTVGVGIAFRRLTAVRETDAERVSRACCQTINIRA